MSATVCNVLGCHFVKRFGDVSDWFEGNVVHEVFQPLSLEVALHYREAAFRWVSSWKVGHVVQCCDIEQLVERFHAVRFVRTQVVHVEREFSLSVEPLELPHEAFEVILGDRSVVSKDMFGACLFGNSGNDCVVARIHFVLVDSQIGKAVAIGFGE